MKIQKLNRRYHNIIAGVNTTKILKRPFVSIIVKDLEYRIFNQRDRNRFDKEVLPLLGNADWMGSSSLDFPHEYTSNKKFLAMVKEMFYR